MSVSYLTASSPADLPAARLATRLTFLAAEFGIACWASLVPFVRQRLGVDEGALGLLLLCIGIGSVTAMLATSPISARHGSRPVILASGTTLAVVLPFLTIAATPLTLGAALLVLDAALGSIDAAMNVHAVQVERAIGTPLLAGFHALFSLGGILGAGLMTALLSLGLAPTMATSGCAAPVAITMAFVRPRLLRGARGEAGTTLFPLPRGIVLKLAGLAAVVLLVEGAMIDWGAVFLNERGFAPVRRAGIGYMLFSTAMTGGRLIGDRVTAWAGDRAMLLWGGLVAVGGFALLLVSPVATLAMAGFLVIGAGCANIVPILFRRAGAQDSMPPALAVGGITTTGYAGILAGPAVIGFVAKAIGLTAALAIVAALLCLVPVCAGLIAGRKPAR